MKKAFPFLFYPVLGLVVGWASVTLGRAGKEPMAAEIAPARHVREGRRALGPVMSSADLLRKIRERQDGKKRFSIGEAITDWTDGEIIAALDEAVARPEATLNDSNMASRLLLEYAQRNPEGALEWAIGQPALNRSKFLSDVLRTWPVERVDDALDLVRKNPDVFGRNVPMSLVPKAITVASAGGPQSVIERLREMTEQGFNRLTTFPDNIAAGFDYGGLLSSPEFQAMGLDSMRSSMIHVWVKRDRDAAFQWMLGENGPGSIFNLRPPSWETTPAKSAELTRWMTEKIEALPPEQRSEFLRANEDRFRQQDSDAIVWIESTKNPELRDAIRTAAAGAIFSGPEDYMDRGLQALATLPDGETRLRALEDILSKRDARPVFGDEGEGKEKLMRTRLAQWGAEPGRVDAIIRQLKGKEIKVIRQ